MSPHAVDIISGIGLGMLLVEVAHFGAWLIWRRKDRT